MNKTLKILRLCRFKVQDYLTEPFFQENLGFLSSYNNFDRLCDFTSKNRGI